MAHEQDPPAVFDRSYWEDRYATPGLTWSGNPNPWLVSEATALRPGRALDVGSGEGGDALWLAARGWSVTGIDIAQAALDKARSRIEAIDPVAAARIEWQQRDLSSWAPEPRAFDLVSSQFLHLPDPMRSAVFLSLAAAVAPGGTLLIVGHDATKEEGEHRAHLAELMFSVDDVLTVIAGEGLRIDAAESRSRVAASGHDDHGRVRDVVVKATRAS